VNEEEMFTRLLYFGLANLGLSEDEIWLMPIGKLLDLFECHRQYLGISKPYREIFIDEVISENI
jgi:hypothetical protein